MGSSRPSAVAPARTTSREKGTTPGTFGTSGTDAAVEIAGVAISSPDRVVFPDQGLTKLELARYYERVADRILPHLVDRPLSLVRCPRGSGSACFFQRHPGESFPPSILRLPLEADEGEGDFIALRELPGLIYLVQIGVLELHTWGARRDRLDAPDRLILDLDPDPAAPWDLVRDGALTLRDRLLDLGLRSFLKTTGGKGLHVVVPLRRTHRWEDVRAFSRGLAEALERRAPDRYIAEASKQRRKGKVYIDYLRNAWGASFVAPYSTRSKAGAPVSMPLRWEELEGDVRGDSFNVRNLGERLAGLEAEPWEGFFETKQAISAAARREVVK